MSRTIILHYHLFKNAGTSVDQILKRNFRKKWVTAEFPQNGGNNSALVSDWIRANPDAVAFSTHTAFGPLPVIEGTTIVSLMMLRDPIARVRSAYRFERKQEADTWGAELAKTHDLEGYVRARLGRPGDRQCRNFQTHRLASMMPGDAPERDRAIAALDTLSVVGLVDHFDLAMQHLADRLRPAFPAFEWETVQANTTAPGGETRREGVVAGLLDEANRDDMAVLEAARARVLVA